MHRWETLIGGMCRAGFSIEDLVEPPHADEQAAIGTFGHRSRYVPPYVRIKARRIGSAPLDPARLLIAARLASSSSSKTLPGFASTGMARA